MKWIYSTNTDATKATQIRQSAFKWAPHHCGEFLIITGEYPYLFTLYPDFYWLLLIPMTQLSLAADGSTAALMDGKEMILPRFFELIIQILSYWCCAYLKTIIRSGHNFALVTTAELSWHVQNCDLIESLESKLVIKRICKHLGYELLTPLWNGPQVVTATHH